eukprot:g18827.t1
MLPILDSNPKLPPSKMPDAYSLVLDLDETLVHYSEHDGMGSYEIRPGMQEFLQRMHANGYELIIFTAATQDYADWVIDQIDPDRWISDCGPHASDGLLFCLIHHRLYRQHALPWGPIFVKDLSRMGRDLDRTSSDDFYAIVDFECTCVRHTTERKFKHEIIEFPVVFLNAKTLEVDLEFHRYVRPTEKPELTDWADGMGWADAHDDDFCRELTGIQQAWVDEADTIDVVLRDFYGFLEEHSLFHRPSEGKRCFSFCTDGPMDIQGFLKRETRRKGMCLRACWQTFIDVKRVFGAAFKMKPCGLQEMLASRNLHFQGRPHSGLDDSRNIARLVAELLREGDDTEEELNRQRAAAFMVGHFHVPKSRHHALEKESLYGAVILIPQIGRSCGWPCALMFVTVRVYLLFCVNFFLQSILLGEIDREQNVLDLFAGQMWLCDFGAPLEDCPSSPSCTGPGGTQVDGTRNFVKDSLKKIFPDRESEIDEEIDPGEYGAESRMYPRDDLVGDNWLEYVDVSVAGMPLRWKIINGLFILGGSAPRIEMWGGSSAMRLDEDCIVNSVALAFVLHMDELILSTLTSGKITSCLEKCKEYIAATTDTTATEAWQSRIEKPIDNSCRANLTLGVPWELLFSILLCAWFINRYYSRHCDWTWDGWWYYSKPISVPTSTSFTPWQAFFPSLFPVASQSTTYWTMPPIWHAD